MRGEFRAERAVDVVRDECTTGLGFETCRPCEFDLGNLVRRFARMTDDDVTWVSYSGAGVVLEAWLHISWIGLLVGVVKAMR